MPNIAVTSSPEALHPSVWRASQLARSTARCIDTGHLTLSAQLPDHGWPTGTLTELLVQQAGVGELRLLAPALAKVQSRKIVLLQPPHAPQVLGLASMHLTPSQLVWARSGRATDALWAAEQVLRSGTCGALLFWAPHVRGESLRRLHLAAQAGETLFFMMRPLSAAQDSSPAPLRISVRPAAGGVELGFVKRRGPQKDEPLFLPLTQSVVSRLQIPSVVPSKAPAESQNAILAVSQQRILDPSNV